MAETPKGVLTKLIIMATLLKKNNRIDVIDIPDMELAKAILRRAHKKGKVTGRELAAGELHLDREINIQKYSIETVPSVNDKELEEVKKQIRYF